MLYTPNLHSAAYQLYLNKTGRKRIYKIKSQTHWWKLYFSLLPWKPVFNSCLFTLAEIRNEVGRGRRKAKISAPSISGTEFVVD